MKFLINLFTERHLIMRAKENEFIIGLSVTFATLIVIFTILWLGKSNFFVKGLHLTMIVQNANGLSVGDEILFRGMAVGTIQDTEVGTEEISIKLKIEKAPPLPKDSRFVIKSVNLLGEMAIEIIPGKSTQFLTFGETVYGETDKGLSALLDQGKHLEVQIDSILQNINTLSGKQTISNINALLNSWNKTSQNLNMLITGNLNKAIVNFKEIGEQNKQPIHTLLDTLSGNASEIAGTIRNLQKVTTKLDAILDKIQSGDGTLGKLSNNDSLYQHLDHTIQHLDSLVIDIKKNPKRYLEVKIL